MYRDTIYSPVRVGDKREYLDRVSASDPLLIHNRNQNNKPEIHQDAYINMSVARNNKIEIN